MTAAFKLLSFPAIAQEDESHVFRGPFGRRTVSRLEGEALHPSRESLGVLHQIRELLGTVHFAAQYLQMPAAPGGNMVDIGWFGRFDVLNPPTFDYVLQSWDTASKASELSDYSVCTTWGKKGKLAYLLHVLRRKVEYPELKRLVKQQAVQHRVQFVLIEGASSGISLAQDLIHDGMGNVIEVIPKGDKAMRLSMQSAKIEAGQVLIPSDAPWLPTYQHEMATFPKAKSDDQVDSTTQALGWMFRAAGADAWLQIALEYEQTQAQEKLTSIWVNHPDKSMTFFLRDGSRAQREADGSFAISEEDVPGLRRVKDIIFL